MPLSGGVRKVVFALSFALLNACASIPKNRSAIDSVEVQGARAVSEADVEDKLATRPGSRFLGFIRGVFFDYEILDRLTVQRDLSRLERYYHARGYYDAHARAGRVIHTSKNHVRVEFVVEEGRPVLVRRTHLDEVEPLTPELRRVLRDLVTRHLVKGAPFDETRFADEETALTRALTDRGYAYASVTRSATVDLVQRTADITMRIALGPKCVFGDVRVTGLGGLPKKPVLRAINIEPGEPYSTATLKSAEQATLNLGVFAAASVKPALDPKTHATTVPVEFVVEPSKVHAARIGGGVEFDATKSDVHLILGWENRNFFGGLRSYSVTFKPGVVLYPLRTDNFVAPSHLLPEFRLQNEFHQPAFLEARTSGLIRPELSLFPVLLPTQTRSTDVVPGYLELKVAAGVDRLLWRLFGRFTYNAQIEYPFAYLGPRDPNLTRLILSYLELITNLNLVDSRVRPHKGFHIGNSFQVSGGILGGDAKDLRVQPEARGYIPLGRKVTLALRGSLGFLFPFNYGRSLDEDPNVGSVDRIRDQQIVFFRGFFAGGPNSDRGYPIRGIGPYEVVASPAFGGSLSLAQCLQSNMLGEASCRIPVGGATLWEASAEVRFNVVGAFSMATFCDAADVSPRVANLRFSHLHLSCGAGVRYDTPVGALRLDAAYRIPGLQIIGPRDPTDEEPKDLFGSIPVAISFGIGEAF